MPWAPRRIADCTARFMARRKVTRRSSCWAIFSATSFASISGFLISTMLRVHLAGVDPCRSLPQALDLLALLADHHPRPGRVDRDAAFLAGRSMTMRRHAGARRSFQEAADLEILRQEPGIAVVVVPARVPGAVDAEPEADRVYLLTHQAASSTRSRTTIRRRLTCFSIRDARPRARACNRFITRCLPTLASAMTSRSTSRLWLFSALAIADSSTFFTVWAIRFLENSSAVTARPAFLLRVIAPDRDHDGRMRRMHLGAVKKVSAEVDQFHAVLHHLGHSAVNRGCLQAGAVSGAIPPANREGAAHGNSERHPGRHDRHSRKSPPALSSPKARCGIPTDSSILSMFGAMVCFASRPANRTRKSVRRKAATG